MLHQKSTAASLKEDGPPPFLGTWNRVYVAIIIYLVCIIAWFGIFTAAFNR